jgi:hypothetical protein
MNSARVWTLSKGRLRRRSLSESGLNARAGWFVEDFRQMISTRFVSPALLLYAFPLAANTGILMLAVTLPGTRCRDFGYPVIGP